MYVCICHAFTDKQVARKLRDGARTTAGVYRSLGCAPQCGKCVPHVRDMVREHGVREHGVREPVGCSHGGAGQPGPAGAFLVAAE